MVEIRRKFIAIFLVLTLFMTSVPFVGSVHGIDNTTEEALDNTSNSAVTEPESTNNETENLSVENQKGITTSPDSISLLADTTEFVSVEMIEGEQAISGVAPNASYTSEDPSIATFRDGKICGHSQGSTIVRIDQPDGDTKTVYVSTYFSYPQPKTSRVQASGDGMRMSRWAGNPDENYVGPALSEGDRLTILWRSRTEDNLTMQYVETNAGDRGYVRSNIHSDRPFEGNMEGYFADMAPGETVYKYPVILSVPSDMTSDFAIGNANVVSASMVDRSPVDNQIAITGLSEGISSVTAIIDYNSTVIRTTAEITVYNPRNLKGTIKSDGVIVRRGASLNYNPDRIVNMNTALTISGECGNFYRIGANEYVLKSDIIIHATEIDINQARIDLEVGTSATLHGTAVPSFADDRLVDWKTHDADIATAESSGNPESGGINPGTITAVKPGTTYIATELISNTNVRDTVDVAAYTPIKSAKAKISKDNTVVRWGGAVACDEVVRMDKNDSVTVTGACGNYWRVEENKYVHKDNIDILITSLKFPRNPITVTLGSKVSSELIIEPEIASVNNVKLTTSKGSVATIGKDLMVTAKKTGITTLTATSAFDNKVKASTKVKVSPRPSGANTSKYASSLLVNLTRSGKSYNQISFAYYGMSKDRTTPAKHYRIYRKGKPSGEYKLIRSVNFTSGYRRSIKDYDITEGKFYVYMLVAYENKSSNKALTKESIVVNKGAKKKPKLSPPKNFKATKTKNMKKANSIKLSWKKVSGVIGYKLYRLVPGQKSYVWHKNLSANRTSFTDKGLKANKKYYYRIISYKKQRWASNNAYWSTYCSKRNENKVYSKPVTKKKAKKIRNKSKAIDIAKDTRTYFDNRWNFVNIGLTQAEVATVENDAIKYNYRNGRLQIHLYIDFSGQSVHDRKGGGGATYHNLFISGLTSMYEININGYYKRNASGKIIGVREGGNIDDDRDFRWLDSKGKMRKLIFDTKVYVHESNKKNSRQKYIDVQMGGECPVSGCTTATDHWYHAHTPRSWSRGYNDFKIYMPRDEQLANNSNVRRRNIMNEEDYSRTSTHEMGHVLGLADAYAADDDTTTDTEAKENRITRNRETVTEVQIADDTVHTNIMEYQYIIEHVKPNDIEMILNASRRNREQAYRRHRWEGMLYRLSGVIVTTNDNPNFNSPFEEE